MEPVPAVPPAVNVGSPLRYGGLQGGLHRPEISGQDRGYIRGTGKGRLDKKSEIL